MTLVLFFMCMVDGAPFAPSLFVCQTERECQIIIDDTVEWLGEVVPRSNISCDYVKVYSNE